MKILSITGPNPAAGAELSYTVPAGSFWLLHSMRINFVTDATAANRVVELFIDDGVNEVIRTCTFGAVTAAKTAELAFGSFGTPQTIAVSGTVAFFWCPLPYRLPLPAGYRIQTLTSNIQGGDDYGALQLLVELEGLE